MPKLPRRAVRRPKSRHKRSHPIIGRALIGANIFVQLLRLMLDWWRH